MISLNVEEALLLNSGRLPAASPSLRPGGVGGHTGLRQPPGGTSGATSTPGATTEDNLKKQIQLGQLLLSSVNCIFYNSDHVWCFSSSIICLLKSGQVKAIAQPGAQSYLSYSKFSKRDIDALQHVEKVKHWWNYILWNYQTIKLEPSKNSETEKTSATFEPCGQDSGSGTGSWILWDSWESFLVHHAWALPFTNLFPICWLLGDVKTKLDLTNPI